MGADIEEKLKTQSDGKNKNSGNLINDKRRNTNFNSSEDVGVIEVNWKGLYQDCKYAWISVGIFMILMLYGVWSLSSKGYFESKKINEEVTKVKILEVTNYFGKKILIAGDITNNIPVEIRLPQKCVVDPRWIGSEVELRAARYQNNHTKISSFKFSGVDNLCDSTVGYLKAKEEREKMKELVHKISSYDLLPDLKIDEKVKTLNIVEIEQPKEVEMNNEKTLVINESEKIIKSFENQENKLQNSDKKEVKAEIKK